MGVFLFFELYKWYQIEQSTTYLAQSCFILDPIASVFDIKGEIESLSICCHEGKYIMDCHCCKIFLDEGIMWKL